MTSNTWPAWLNNAYMIGMAVIGLIIYYRQSKNSPAIQRVDKELKPNSGTSVKDLAKAAADDSNKTIVLLTEINGRLVTTEQNQQASREAIDKIAAENSQIRGMVARYVLHEANKDLGHSDLVKELRRLEANREARIFEPLQADAHGNSDRPEHPDSRAEAHHPAAPTDRGT